MYCEVYELEEIDNQITSSANRRMKRSALIASLVGEILARKQNASTPLRVGIDGRCASGKTTLADELASGLAASWPDLQILRPSVDGFHHSKERRYRQGEFSARGYYEDAYDYQTLLECLLGPLSNHEFPVWCRQVSRDWRTDLSLDAPAVSVGPDSVLLFEGVFVLRTEINRYWDLRILVDVDAESSIERAIERDNGSLGSREIVEKKYRLRYEPAWQIYVGEEHPELKADLIVNNQDVQNPTLSSRLANRKDEPLAVRADEFGVAAPRIP